LVGALNCDGVDFFIHIDKKVDIAPFKTEVENLVGGGQVHFLSDDARVRVNWGGYTQVVFQRNMIQCAIDSQYSYKRIVMLTGTDYPTVSNEVLVETLCNTDKEFIIGFDINREEYQSGRRPPHQNRFLYVYRYDNGKFVRGVFNHLKIHRVKSVDDFEYKYYYGSEYWCLSYECVKELMDAWDRDEKLQHIMKSVFAPSESWIHTLFFNSSYADKGIQYRDYEHRELANLSPLEYFYYVGKVKVLNDGDYEAIVKSNKMFCRKVIAGQSDLLIELLNAKRENHI
jgi:hypothetical protein